MTRSHLRSLRCMARSGDRPSRRVTLYNTAKIRKEKTHQKYLNDIWGSTTCPAPCGRLLDKNRCFFKTFREFEILDFLPPFLPLGEVIRALTRKHRFLVIRDVTECDQFRAPPGAQEQTYRTVLALPDCGIQKFDVTTWNFGHSTSGKLRCSPPFISTKIKWIFGY